MWDSKTMSWSNPNFVDLAADAGTGVIKLRPNMLKYAKEPVILHELLRAYHRKLMAGARQSLNHGLARRSRSRSLRRWRPAVPDK